MSREVLALLNTNDAQVIELLFNIVHQEPASTFEQIAAKEVGVIVKVPLDSGWLAGAIKPTPNYGRAAGARQWSAPG